MRWISLALFLGLVLTTNAQEIQVTVSGNIFNADADSIYLYPITGEKSSPIKGTKFKKNGDFEIKTKVPSADYYSLRFGSSKVDLILREDSEIKVYGDGAKIDQFCNIVGSDESAKMNEFTREKDAWVTYVDSVNQVISADPSQQNSLRGEFQQKQQQYQTIVRAFIQANQNSAALYAIQSIIDPNVDFEGYENITKQLMAGFSESPTVQAEYSKMEKLKKEMLAKDPLAPGKMAPDFTEAMPDGEMLSLSDLRGNVVLLDFWASWCGPCRRENPNVVALYEKYKDKGFTVMSVSLDKDKDKWLKAIENDNLSWPNHVSDLQFWQSKAAKLYGVSGIPFTVLIDKEGKIIRTKLRGPQLEEELSRIFGDS
ncbi:MAG: AhpC/TSA family protein [bacterium]|nr:AhpC/TSA family protein [bacterium]